MHFEIDQVIPTAHPFVQQLLIAGFHDLEATYAFRIEPTRVVIQSVGHHAAVGPKSLSDFVQVTKPFDDHVKHHAPLSAQSGSRSLGTAEIIH